MPVGRQGQSASSSAAARIGRKKQLVVCEFNCDQRYKVLGASKHWVEFETQLVRATPELEAVWQQDRELWGLVQQSRAVGHEPQSFRTTGKNFWARDTFDGHEYEVESILVLPGGDLRLSWKTSPAHMVGVDQNVEEDEDALRARIEELQSQLLEAQNDQRVRTEQLEEIISQKDLEIERLQLIVRNQKEVVQREVMDVMEAAPERQQAVVEVVPVPAFEVQEVVNDLINEIENAENDHHAPEDELVREQQRMEI